MTNIIKFPAHKIVRENAEFMDNLKKNAAPRAAEDLVDFISSNLQENLENIGMDEKKGFEHDFIILEEAVRSLIYRQFGLEHVYQTINLDEEDEEPINLDVIVSGVLNGNTIPLSTGQE